MTVIIPPPTGEDWRVWGRQIRGWLGANFSRLAFWSTEATAAENGVLLWDEVQGCPVVSKNGEWVGVNLADKPSDFAVQIAEAEILRETGDTVSTLDAASTILKFGRKDDLGTTLATVWTVNDNEVFATSNTVDTISSSDAADTQTIVIEGCTVTGTGTSSEFTAVSQTKALNGQTKVVIDTPLARVDRMYVQDNSIPAGDVYCYEDTTISGGVPTTTGPIKNKILATETQSFKAALIVPNDMYLILTGGFVSVERQSAAAVDFDFELRTPGGVFRPVSRIGLKSDSETVEQISLNPYAVIPKNSDVRIRAISDRSNTAVTGSFQGYFAKVQA